MPTVFVYDDSQVKANDQRWTALAQMRDLLYTRDLSGRPESQHYDLDPFKLVAWDMDMPGVSQREKMLTGLVHGCRCINTPWYLKLDADTYGTKRTGFYYDRWFQNGIAYISNPWGYTKPGGTIAKMNAWATTVPELAKFPDVTATTVDMGNGRTKDCHPRMASWVMFGNTAWTQQALDLCRTPRLPFPSQDTYLSYIQVRTGAKWIPQKFSKFGFSHAKNYNHLRSECLRIYNEQRLT
jgi:hypothetical protein